MRASILTLVLVLLAGCSLLGNDGTPLDFRTVGLTQVDSLQVHTLALDAVRPGSNGRLFLITQSAEEAERLRLATGLSRIAIPDVDWTRESLFLVTVPLRPSQRLRVESVRLKRDAVEIEAVTSTAVGGATGDLQTVIVAVRITGAPRERGGLSFSARPAP